MNRRKFLIGLGAAAVAVPVVVESLQHPVVASNDMAFPASDYLTSNTAWHIKDPQPDMVKFHRSNRLITAKEMSEQLLPGLNKLFEDAYAGEEWIKVFA